MGIYSITYTGYPPLYHTTKEYEKKPRILWFVVASTVRQLSELKYNETPEYIHGLSSTISYKQRNVKQATNILVRRSLHRDVTVRADI